MKKRNWEIEYEKYKSTDTQVKLEELKNKLDAKTITRQEYDEYQKMLKVIDNLPKVENVIEYMEKLDQDLSVLKEEIRAREEQRQIEEKRIKPENLEKELEANLNKQYELIAKRKEINKKIALTSDKQEIEKLKLEKEEVNQELSKLELQAKQNNDIFVEIHSTKKENKKLTKAYLAKYSDEDLRAKCFEISAMISKCNMVASNLMKGLSRDSLQVKLEGWKDRKFTSKEPLPLTRREKMAIKEENSSVNETEDKEETEEESTLYTNAKEENEWVEFPRPLSEFEKAFPRLAKRFPKLQENFIGKTMLAIKNRFRPIEEEKEEQEDKQEMPQQLETNEPAENDSENSKEEENSKTKKEKFMNYVKYDVLEVAEKGIEQVQKEDLENRKKRLEEMKKEQNETDKEER